MHTLLLRSQWRLMTSELSSGYCVQVQYYNFVGVKFCYIVGRGSLQMMGLRDAKSKKLIK